MMYLSGIPHHKLVSDDISLKYIFTKSKEFNVYAFGSSRCATIDPGLIEENLKKNQRL